MKISVARSGGFAGLTRTWAVHLDEQHDAAEWKPLLDALPWEQASGSSAARASSADRYVYRIRVSRRQVVVPEQELDGAWRDLVDRVCARADG